MSPRLNNFGVSLCVAVAAATILAAQEQRSGQPQPTFRTSVQSVRVDLYVTHDGKPVTDLRQDEIQLVEDGTPQAIQTFEQITVAPHTAAEPAQVRTLEESRQRATDPRSRLFVVFVPPRTTSAFAAPLMQARIPVLRQLNNLLGPDDLVAVVTPDTRISELTFQRRLALNSSTWFDEGSEDPRHTLWDICYPAWIPGSPNAEMKARHRELMTFEALDALIAHLGGLRDERKHVLVLSEGFRLYLRNPNLGAGMRAGSGPQSPRRGAGPGPGPDDPVGNAMISTKQCETDRIDLGSLDHAGRLDEIAAHARRNNVSFYPISPPGPSVPAGRRTFGGGGGPFSNRTTSERQAALRGLADDTGGSAIINTKDIDGGLQKIIAGTASYYLLGYSSTNPALDGRFRRISVKVNRSNVQIRARPGYVALPPLDSRPMPVLDTRIAPTPVEHAMRTLASSRSTLLHVRSAAWTRAGSSGTPSTALWIVGELDAQIQRRQPSTGWTGEMTLRPTRGGPPISRAITVAPGSSTFAVEWRESDNPLPSGEYSVQLQLTDASGRPVGEFGRVTVADASSPLGEAMLLRRGATTAQRYVRTADPRFVRTDRLRLELPTDIIGASSATVRDSRGAELAIPAQITERSDESGLFRWITIDVPLTSLAPADYAVEVAHGGVTRVTAFRLTP